MKTNNIETVRNHVPPVPPGNYPARLIALYDLGTQLTEYQGQSKLQRKIMLTFELIGEREIFDETKGPQPRVISRQFTWSGHEKSGLRILISAWLGKKFTDSEFGELDLTTLLGQAGLVNVSHTERADKTYANIVSVTPVPKGINVLKNENLQVFYSLSEHNQSVFDSLPGFVKKIIQKSVEYNHRAGDQSDDFEGPELTDEDRR